MWLHIPTSHCSPEPEGSTSPSGLLYQRLAQSATWKTKSLPPKSWQRELRKGRLTKRLSGLMSEPFQADCSVATWLESLADSHARIIPSPASAPGSSASMANYGTPCDGSFARYQQVGSFWRTSQESFIPTQLPNGAPNGICLDGPSGRVTACLPDFPLYSQTWPKWGSMRNGAVYQQAPWAPAISAIDGSVLLTARSEDAESCGNHPGAVDSLTGAVKLWKTPHGMSGKDRTGKVGGGGEFAKEATLWSTPSVPNGGRTLSPEDIQNRGKTAKGKRQVGLENEASLWATPQAHDQAGGNPNRVGRFGTEHGGRNLADDVMMWATPTSAMTTGAGTQGRDGGENLQTQAGSWPSPQSRDWKSGDASEATANANARPLNEAAERWTATDAKKSDDGPKSRARREAGEMLTSDQRLCNQVQGFHYSRPAQATLAGRPCWCGTRGCSLPSHKRRLNPIFASWLQGWPIWWCTKEPTPYGQWATESWLSKARRYLESF